MTWRLAFAGLGLERRNHIHQGSAPRLPLQAAGFSCTRFATVGSATTRVNKGPRLPVSPSSPCCRLPAPGEGVAEFEDHLSCSKLDVMGGHVHRLL
jgi:hypothetical protein